MQRTDRPEWTRPAVATLDFADHVRQAYWNCVNALNMFQSIQMADSGASVFTAEVAWERFEGCVDILESMILETWKDEDYKVALGLVPIITKVKKTRQVKIGTREQVRGEPRFGLEDVFKTEEYEEEETVFNKPKNEHRLDTFKAITELFNRQHIFRTVQTYGGHL